MPCWPGLARSNCFRYIDGIIVVLVPVSRHAAFSIEDDKNQSSRQSRGRWESLRGSILIEWWTCMMGVSVKSQRSERRNTIHPDGTEDSGDPAVPRSRTSGTRSSYRREVENLSGVFHGLRGAHSSSCSLCRPHPSGAGPLLQRRSNSFHSRSCS